MATRSASASAHHATRVIVAFTLAKLLLQLFAFRPYGYFRDELYYLACANHLAFGYVDHPPLSIAVLGAWRAIVGDSIVAIRLVPALAGSAVVYVTGRLVATLGGGSVAIAIACLATLCTPVLIATDHIYSMNTLDHLIWSVIALIAVQTLEQKILSRWLLLGLVIGLGLLNKLSVLWLGAGLVVNLLVMERGRGALRTWGPIVSLVVAGAIICPYVIWQIQHHFPTAEFVKNAMLVKYVRRTPSEFLSEIAIGMNPATIPLALAGIIAPYLSSSTKAARPLSVIFVTTFTIVLLSRSGKPEYLSAAYPLVFASGALWLEHFIERTLAKAAGWNRRAVLAASTLPMVAFCAIALPFALPVLPEASFIRYAARLGVSPKTSEKKLLGELPQHYADMHGWNELVSAARLAMDTLTPEEQRDATIWAVTGGYGSAAAIDVLGRAYGLPNAISTHNSYWIWGHGSVGDGPVILLGGPRERLEELFVSVVQVTTVECGYCMPYENHKPVYVARGIRTHFGELWTTLKHFE